ncbi:MAG: lipoate--protein ligase family protein [Candidatus Omnitrophica bacterium]|jgi:lipoate-protein ligase A|nr:lipoate--protein ligase family protein [Candidatus Omnitrophota bacterium]
MNNKWRLILDDKCNGYYNMAVDEAILCSYSELKVPTLRIYGWSEPFISIGYNQDAAGVLKPEINIPFVRRPTGGAAILHNREITYSLTCSLSDLNLPCEVKKSYEALNSFIKEFYKKLGLRAEFAKDVFPEGLERRENFCFASCEYFDFVINGKKIGGNAQRRKKNLIFQHGSIPQELDFTLIENSINNAQQLYLKTTFLNELIPGGQTDFREIADSFYKAFENVFNVKFDSERLSARERQHSYCLMETKYTTKEWNLKKIHNVRILDEISS